MRMKWFPVTVALLALSLLSACNRPVVRTVDVKVPQLRTPAAAALVRAALTRYGADMVLDVEPDVRERVVRVRYDSTKLAIRNIEHAIADVGFDANDIPGHPGRRSELPEDLR